MSKSRLMRGMVGHTRLKPVRHGFTTRVGFHLFDLEELPTLDQTVRGFGYNRFAPLAIHDRDYLGPEPGSIREKLTPWLAKLNLPAPPARIYLVTAARWFGRVFNPVSFYLLEDETGNLPGLIAEVNNTFGDRHIYAVHMHTAVDPSADPDTREGADTKVFHVSPFNDLQGNYRFTVRRAGPHLHIGVDLHKDNQPFLTAWIAGEGVPFNSKHLLTQALRHPLQPWLTLPKIIFQSLFLKFKHKLPVQKRPEPAHPHTIKSRHKHLPAPPASQS